ncbi:MAG: C2H2-type zinc finger protein [Nitrososphaerota archaeon]
MSKGSKIRQVIWLDPDLTVKVLETAKQLNVPVNMACIELMKRGVTGQVEKVKYVCDECNTEFETKEELLKHAREKHPPLLTCPFCLRPFHDLNLLRKHVLEEAKTWNLGK